MTTIDGGEAGETYFLVEMFCNEPGCDCRRAFIQVFSEDNSVEQPRATISWGWESEAFYRRWAGFPLDDEELAELRGPALVRLATQSEDAEDLLEHFRVVIGDEAYAQRIVRHYQKFRRTVAPPRSSSGAPRSQRNVVAKRREQNKRRRKARAMQRKKRK